MTTQFISKSNDIENIINDFIKRGITTISLDDKNIESKIIYTNRNLIFNYKNFDSITIYYNKN